MKFSCCIEMLFTEYDFIERIYKAKEAGFDAVEFWDWREKDLKAIKKAIEKTCLEIGIMQGSIKGQMVERNDRDTYISGVMESVETAKYLGVKHLFVLSHIMKEDRSVLEPDHPITTEEMRLNSIDVLKRLISIGEKEGITFIIEPLNTKVDHKGYSLCTSRDAFEIIREINHPNILMLYDAYHMQIMEGNIIQTIQSGFDMIGYFHIADVPGRHEPGTGELNYINIIKSLDNLGYKGIVGFEFSPKNGSSMEIAAETLRMLRL